MRQIFIFTLFVLFATTLYAQDGWDNWKPYSSESYYDIQKESSQKVQSESYDVYKPKFYVTKMQNRFLSVDKLADQYPSVTPYHYVLNNPMRFIDPTGMWVASYDSSGNVVSVTYEEGDTYEDLYSQLGISAEQFSEQYGIDLSKGITTTTFDITSYVVSNTGFDANFTGSNCHGFVSFATNPNTTIEVANGQFNLANMSATNSPTTGNIAVFNMQGQYQYVGQDQPVDANNIQGHSAIFIVNNQAGEAQYLNRINTGQPVTVNTQSQIVSYFANPQNAFGGPSAYVILPKLNPSPIYYKR